VRYFICYDISSNKRRTKAAKLLESLGQRMQKSVFLAELNHTQEQSARKKLGQMLSIGDSLFFIPFCRSCLGEAKFLGPKISSALIV
jgi:CRISPR-associated protein Cas2